MKPYSLIGGCKCHKESIASTFKVCGINSVGGSNRFIGNESNDLGGLILRDLEFSQRRFLGFRCSGKRCCQRVTDVSKEVKSFLDCF